MTAKTVRMTSFKKQLRSLERVSSMLAKLIASVTALATTVNAMIESSQVDINEAEQEAQTNVAAPTSTAAEVRRPRETKRKQNKDTRSTKARKAAPPRATGRKDAKKEAARTRSGRATRKEASSTKKTKRQPAPPVEA